MRLAIGLVSVGFVALTLARNRGGEAPPVAAAVAPGLFWGAVSGFASFVSHAGGPPFLVYALPQKLPKALFAGTSVLFFALVNLMKVPPYLWLGQFTRDEPVGFADAAAAGDASTLLGVWVSGAFRRRSFTTS